jgi:4-hydroxy-tetrahydrodipicolinate synthase
MFEGMMTALVTPFQGGKIDEKSLRKLVQFQIKNNINAIVPSGTTGESATLTHPEHRLVTDIVIDEAKKRVKVIAGTGSNSTQEAIDLTVHAEKAGADGCLLITPYYNRPTQEGLYQHFKAIAKKTSLPMIVYNVPSRTGVNMTPETVARLMEIDNIVGLKDASGNLTQTAETLYLTKGRIKIFAGDDSLLLPMLSIGASGGICVVSNIAPKLLAQLWQAWKAGKKEKAMEIHNKLHILNRVLYLETNPIPVKWAVHRMGLISDEIRLPLTVLNKKFQPLVESAMREVGLID